MTKFYTGNGDLGYTGTINSLRVKKDHVLMDAIGSVDELNSAIGVAISELNDRKMKSMQTAAHILIASAEPVLTQR